MGLASKWFLGGLGISLLREIADLLHQDHWWACFPAGFRDISFLLTPFLFIYIDALIYLGNMGAEERHLVMSFSREEWGFYPRNLPSLVLNCLSLLTRNRHYYGGWSQMWTLWSIFCPFMDLLSCLIQAQFKNFLYLERVNELRKQVYKSSLCVAHIQL